MLKRRACKVGPWLAMVTWFQEGSHHAHNRKKKVSHLPKIGTLCFMMNTYFTFGGLELENVLSRRFLYDHLHPQNRGFLGAGEFPLYIKVDMCCHNSVTHRRIGVYCVWLY